MADNSSGIFDPPSTGDFSMGYGLQGGSGSGPRDLWNWLGRLMKERAVAMGQYKSEVLDPAKNLKPYDPNEAMAGFKSSYFGTLAGTNPVTSHLKGMGVGGADVDQYLSAMQPAQAALGAGSMQAYNQKAQYDRADMQNYANLFGNYLNIGQNRGDIMALLSLIKNIELND